MALVRAQLRRYHRVVHYRSEVAMRSCSKQCKKLLTMNSEVSSCYSESKRERFTLSTWENKIKYLSTHRRISVQRISALSLMKMIKQVLVNFFVDNANISILTTDNWITGGTRRNIYTWKVRDENSLSAVPDFKITTYLWFFKWLVKKLIIAEIKTSQVRARRIDRKCIWNSFT